MEEEQKKGKFGDSLDPEVPLQSFLSRLFPHLSLAAD